MAQSSQASDTARLEAFSDGVFAIAITLLVLDIKVPRELSPHASLLAALSQQWPTFLAFITSFLTILVTWANHHVLFRHIVKSDNSLLFLNGLLLLFITFLPFPTSLLAEYLREPGQAREAAFVYSVTLGMVAVLFHVLWWYARTGSRLLGPHPDQAAVDAITRSYRFGPMLYGVAAATAWVSVPVCLAFNLGLAVFFAFTGRRS